MKPKQLNVAEAKAKLSQLVDQAARGKTVVIAKAGLPVAKLVPLDPAPKRVRFGVLEGTLTAQAIAALEAPLDQDTINLMNSTSLLAPERS